MTMRFSIYYSLQTSRWGESHLPNKPPPEWPQMVEDLRLFWEQGDDTILETYFYEPFKKKKGNPHWPDFMNE